MRTEDKVFTGFITILLVGGSLLFGFMIYSMNQYAASWDRWCASKGYTHVHQGRGDFCRDSNGRIYLP